MKPISDMTTEERLATFAKRAYSSVETIKASYTAGAHIIEFSVPGHIVECGVAAGSNVAAMAHGAGIDEEENEDGFDNDGREVHLFDSFTGIPLAGVEDVEFLEAGHPAGLSAHSLTEVKGHLKGWGFDSNSFVFHPGMFQDTIPAWAATKPQIALLRLDGDLYESTKVCLEHLVPLVVPGGIIIIDDWDLSGCRKAVLDYMGGGFGPIQFQRHR